MMWEQVETGSRWADDKLRAWIVVDQVMVTEQVYVQLRRYRGRKRLSVEADRFKCEFTRVIQCSKSIQA